MNALFVIFLLLTLACAAMLLASLFTPRAALFFKDKTKPKGFLLWMGLGFACLLVAGNFAPPVASEPTQTVVQAPVSPLPSELTKERTPEEQTADRARMVEKTTAAQAKLMVLYNELLAMRGTPAFVELAFSTKNKPAVDWQARVNAFRDSIGKDMDIAIEVRAAPGYLLGLGLDKAWRAGGMTDKAKWDNNMVQEALNWKMPD